MDVVQWYLFVFNQLHSRHGSISLMIYNNNNNNNHVPSSVSATPPVIEIYFLIGNDSTPRELSPLFPFRSPSGGSRIYFPSPLAIGPSTIQSHWGFYALCCPSGLPSISQHHDVASHPFLPLLPR